MQELHGVVSVWKMLADPSLKKEALLCDRIHVIGLEILLDTATSGRSKATLKRKAFLPILSTFKHATSWCMERPGNRPMPTICRGLRWSFTRKKMKARAVSVHTFSMRVDGSMAGSEWRLECATCRRGAAWRFESRRARGETESAPVRHPQRDRAGRWSSEDRDLTGLRGWRDTPPDSQNLQHLPPGAAAHRSQSSGGRN
jgi:hypothetical protein